jgi:telomere length regulation protein
MARGDEGSAVAARLYRAAAEALIDAKHPGEVEQTLEAVRRVVLPLGGGSEEGTPGRSADEASSSATRGTDAQAEETLFPDKLASLTALTDAVLASTSAKAHTPARVWDGFEPLGEQMLHLVAPAWLPCMTSERRTRLYDDILDAMPPSLAVRVLVPALSPSRTSVGRALRDPDAQRAVATEAAEALERAVAAGAAGKLCSAARFSDADLAAADEDCRALISAADRCELAPGAHSLAAAALHPAAFARTVAAQFIEAATEAEARPPRGADETLGGEETCAAAVVVAARAVSAMARRGDAAAVADALIEWVTRHDSGIARDSPGDSTAMARAARRTRNLRRLTREMPDAHAAEKVASAILKACDAKSLAWRVAERVLRLAFAERFWTCDTTRHALSDALLVRKPSPRRVLPALVRFVVVDPPPPPEPPAGSADPSAADCDGSLETVDLVAAHRTRALASVANAWSDPELIRAGAAKLRGHVASVAAACLAAVPVDAWRSRRGGVGLVGAASLMRGVSARLDSPDADTRRHGRKVASALALALDPARPLTFDDDEDFGAGEFRDPEGVSGDVSEDEAEWERGDAVFELRDDAEASEEKNREEQSEDAFVASLVGDEAEANLPLKSGDGDGRASNPELSHSEGDDERVDDDDPDAAFALGGGGAEASASSEDSDSDDSDDSDASSAYEPYDMDSDEDEDEDEHTAKNEGGVGGDAFGKTGTPQDASRRRARAAKAAARRVASLPKPDGLFRCVEALRQKRGGEESASSRSAVDLADAAEGAVYAIEGLIRAVPEELVSAAAPLVSALVHAHPPTPDAAGLERARRKALVALAATAPGIAGPALCAEAFATGRCDAGQQLEVLDVVADAARELAALAPVRRAALRDADDEDDEGDVTATTRETKTSAALRRRGRVGVERRFAPRSLARLRGSSRTGGPGAPQRTRAHLVVDAFAGPLLARLGALVRSADADAEAARAAERAAAADPDSAHVPGGGIDALVLGRALGALGECCASAANAANAAQLAGAVLELISSPSVHEHRHPHVRRAALFAAFGAVTSTPPAAAWHALAGGGRADAASMSRLGRLLSWAEAWSEKTHASDADATTRQLALRCALSSADLRQKASAAGAGRRDRDDPLFVLKNLTALAVDS